MPNTRWNEILTHLRAEIESGAKKPGDKLPSESAIAAEWQVCRMTAHRAMSELTREGLVTRKRRAGTIVSAPAKEIPVARAIRHVALLCFHSNDFPQANYVHGFRAGLHEDHHVLLCDTRNDAACEATYLRRLQSEADAICLYATCHPANNSVLRDIAASGTPLIFLDRIPDGVVADGIVTDNRFSTQEAVGSLIAQGHSRIAFFTTDNSAVPSVRERLEGYAAAMDEAALPWESQVRVFPRGAGYAFDAFADAVRETLSDLLSGPDAPTAVLCLEDYFLAATIEACETLGLSVPGDLEILSFNDCPPPAPKPTLRIQRIVQQAYHMGHLAAQHLQERLDGTVDTAPWIRRVPAQLYLRDQHSSKPATLSAGEIN